jgi:hypothetical protein
MTQRSNLSSSRNKYNLYLSILLPTAGIFYPRFRNAFSRIQNFVVFTTNTHSVIHRAISKGILRLLRRDLMIVKSLTARTKCYILVQRFVSFLSACGNTNELCRSLLQGTNSYVFSMHFSPLIYLLLCTIWCIIRCCKS